LNICWGELGNNSSWPFPGCSSHDGTLANRQPCYAVNNGQELWFASSKLSQPFKGDAHTLTPGFLPVPSFLPHPLPVLERDALLAARPGLKSREIYSSFQSMSPNTPLYFSLPDTPFERPSQSHRTRVEQRHTLIGRDPISRGMRDSCAELRTHKGRQPRQQGVIRARQQTTFRKCCRVPRGSGMQGCRYFESLSGRGQVIRGCKAQPRIG
jgi:hypothetical protein